MLLVIQARGKYIWHDEVYALGTGGTLGTMGTLGRRSPHLLAVCVALVLGSACDNPNTPEPPPPPTPTLTITCPPGQTVEGVSGSTGKAVTYPTPPTTGGTAPVAVACAPASGTTLQVGTTTVNCTARDSATQQATCSFSVTLTPRLLQVGKFMAFGDSMTEGENGISVVLRRPAVIIPGTPYPAQLAAMLIQEYPTQNFQVVNKGVSGRFAEKGAEDLPKDLASEHPEVVLLLDGYNNLFNECPATGSVTSRCTGAMDVVITALSKDISNARSSGVKYVFVSTLTPAGPVTGPRDRRINGDAIVMMNGRIASLLPGQGAVLVDTYPRFLGHEAEYVSTDGLHLRPAGYEALARSFYDSINATIPWSPAVSTQAALRTFGRSGRGLSGK